MGKSPSHKKETVNVPKWAKEQDSFTRGKKYPNCKGTFPDCPEVITDIVLDVCRNCPFYR
ncbi:MAG: hypothetical protein NDI94_06805 [Candidatus Woesearchaeota archaeon]|nr:hypothetical protein [Candidatus Woesearchaeota archaeon]